MGKLTKAVVALGVAAGVCGTGALIVKLRREQAAFQEKLQETRILRGHTESARQLIGRGDLGGALLQLEKAYAQLSRAGADDAMGPTVRTLLPLLSARASLHLHTLQHDGEVTAVRFSPDGRLALTASGDRTARIWDVATGTERLRLGGHSAALAGAWFSASGDRVLTLTRDGQARLFRTRPEPGGSPLTGVLADPGGQPLSHVAFTPDSARVVTLAQGARAATLWDAVTGQRLAVLGGHEAPILTTAVGAPAAQSGARVVTVSPQNALLWDATRGTLVAALRGHTDHIKDAVFSPDGQRVVTTSADTTARLWDAATGKLVTILEGHTGTVYSASFTLAGGKAIMTISADGSARLWDKQTGQAMFLPVGHPRYSQILGISDDGSRMVVSSESEALELWDRILGNMRAQLLPSARDVLATSFSPNGRRLATTLTDGTTRLWDGRSGQPLLVLRGHRDRGLAVAISPDGRLVLSGSADGSARLYQSRLVGSGPLAGWPQPLDGHPSEIAAVAFGPDGKSLLSTSRNGSARLWKLPEGELVHSLEGHGRSVDFASFLPAGDGHGPALLTGNPGGTAGNGRFPADVRIWDAGSGALTRTLGGQLELGRVLATTPDGGRIATAQPDGRVQIYRPASGTAAPERIAEMSGHAVEPALGAFSPDGTLLATASSDGRVEVWQGGGGGRIASLKGHNGAVGALAFDVRGRLLSGCADGTARLFDPRSGSLIAQLPGHHGEVRALFPDPTGARLLSVDTGERAWLWELPAGGAAADGAGDRRLIGALSKHGARDYAAVAWSPDGRRIATAGDEIRLWDGRTAAQIASLDDSGKLETFTALAWSPDGGVLATGSLTGQLKLWDVHLESRDPATVHEQLLRIPAVSRSAAKP